MKIKLYEASNRKRTKLQRTSFSLIPIFIITLLTTPLANAATNNNSDDAYVSASSLKIEEFKTSINDSTEYLYSDLYNIDEALKKYDNVTQNDKYTDDIIGLDKKITLDELYRSVLQNNEDYLKNQSMCFYDKLSKKDMEKILQIVVDTINYELQNNKYIDIEIVSSVLSNLKLFQDATPSNAYLSDDYCLIVNPEMMDILQMMTNSDTDAFKATIVHETMHILQIQSPESQLNQNVAVTYKWNDLKVNPLYFDWLCEGSAEKSMMNYTGNEAVTYSNLVGYIESMNYTTILDDDVEVNQTENICFTHSLDLLFEQFNCETDEEKESFIQMMYGCQVMQMSPDDFYAAFEKKYNKELTEKEKDELRYKLRASVCEDLSKYFYSNLADSMSKNKVTLDDIFYLINIFEKDMYSHVKYDNEDLMEENQHFIDSYVKIQNDFFELISNNNYSKEDITLKFNNYKPKKATLSWLSKEKREYIYSHNEDLSIYDDNDTINEVQAIIAEKSKKA